MKIKNFWTNENTNVFLNYRNTFSWGKSRIYQLKIAYKVIINYINKNIVFKLKHVIDIYNYL